MKTGKTPQTNPPMVHWEEPPEHLKESNRQQTDHIGEKLKAIGCEIDNHFSKLLKLLEKNKLSAQKCHEKLQKSTL